MDLHTVLQLDLFRKKKKKKKKNKRKVILKDRFLTQSAPGICYKLLKRVYGPNQSLDTLLQLAQTVYYDRECEGGKKAKKDTHTKRQKLSKWL